MSNTVVILGAKGRFGRAASEAFHASGWSVRTFARNWPADTNNNRFERYEGNAFDSDAVTRAADGCDVIVNALNPRYKDWKRELPKLTISVIAAAKSTGASVMIPGNIYNYGASIPPILTEDTPHRPTTRKGELRKTMEETYAASADDGVQTIILRAGDFIERAKTGNWFDTYMTHKADRGVLHYPGPLSLSHAWAYLPDAARAMAMLAEKRGELSDFSDFAYEGFNLTGVEFVQAVERVHGDRMTVKSIPWQIMQVLGWFTAPMREVVEMKYLWDVSHAIDGSRLRSFLTEFRPTSLDDAFRDALGVQSQQPVSDGARTQLTQNVASAI